MKYKKASFLSVEEYINDYLLLPFKKLFDSNNGKELIFIKDGEYQKLSLPNKDNLFDFFFSNFILFKNNNKNGENIRGFWINGKPIPDNVSCLVLGSVIINTTVYRESEYIIIFFK